MATLTPNYGLIKPGVNDPTDQDLWGGMLNQDLDTIDTVMKANETLALRAELPVGSLYFNATDSTNPATLLGYGTWTSFGAGRVLLGVGTGTDANGVQETFSQGDTGGEYEHEQTAAELAPHFHHAISAGTAPPFTNPTASNRIARSWSAGSDIAYSLSGTNDTATLGQTSQVGSGDAMPWMQPYIAVHIWQRTG